MRYGARESRGRSNCVENCSLRQGAGVCERGAGKFEVPTGALGNTGANGGVEREEKTRESMANASLTSGSKVGASFCRDARAV